ncbi:MAG: GTP-binding protein [Deltaproteobacteria bacterium]|nr:GTP-binding protein [Deltaproteobacteria bacterium]MCW5807278.1 GTP-binding protein [Deltaproteobacteria bacterium]
MVRVPFVVLTGFLGSGKTTLVNRILARRAARAEPSRLGLVVNELGAIGIDGALLAGAGDARQVELPGGCVCCVLGDELDRTLLDLVEAGPLDAILLETTGVAEPVSIAWAVARPPVADRIRLAAVVTLVDATELAHARTVSRAADAQVAYADTILVTKAELAGPAATAAVLSEVRTIAPRAEIRTGSTDDHAAWLEYVLADPPLERIRPGAAPHVHDEHCGHDHEGVAHGIASVAVRAPGTFDLEELEDRLGELPADYVRIKGIVRAVDPRTADAAARWTAVHRVGLRVSSEPLARAYEGDAVVVALGPSVDAAELTACIDDARISV